jgi:hypothetical protein
MIIYKYLSFHSASSSGEAEGGGQEEDQESRKKIRFEDQESKEEVSLTAICNVDLNFK